MKTVVVTDSNSGITQSAAKEMGIYVVPMPVLIDGEIFYEDLTLTQEQFYEKLKSNASVSTSQPNPLDVGDIWDKALKDADELVYIPMSSGLSETCHTLQHYAETEERFKGKVFVVDNQRISITQKQSVYDTIKLANEGKSGKEISDWLLKTKMQSSIYIMVDTLKYLKKGGRLTPAVALIGTMLKIKPVLQIQGFKLDQYAKVRKLNDAKTTMINAVKIEIAEQFPDLEIMAIDPLSLSVSCHIGPGALAMACMIKY